MGKRRPAPGGTLAPRLGLGSPGRGASSLTRSGGVALPGRPAQCKKQPERPERGRAHGARLDGAAAVRSAQQVTSLSERRKEVGAGRGEGEEEGKELEGGKGSGEEEGTPSPTTCTISSPPASPPTYPPTYLPRLQQLCKASLREENNAGAAEERAEEGRVQERRGGGGELRAEEKAEDTEAGPGAPTLATAGARGEELGGGRRGSGQRGGGGRGGEEASALLSHRRAPHVKSRQPGACAKGV